MNGEHNEACSSILDLLTEAARGAGGAIAVVAPGRKPLTYGHLYHEVLAAAAMFRNLGLGREDRVALVLPNGPEMAVAFLAASTAATCAPLNPAYRAAEFDFYLGDLRAKAVVVQQGLASPVREIAAERGLPIIELVPVCEAEAGRFALTATSWAACPVEQWPQSVDVALLLHTSGTTSRPKLVPLTHGQLCASATHIRRALSLRPDDRCLNVMPLFHIHGLVASLLATLSAGGSVACTPGFDATTFFNWLDELSPTWYTAVPTMHQAVLVEAANRRDLIARRPLRLIRSSSSALPPQVMRGLEEVFHAPVIEAYGMTEAAHQMCSNPLPPAARKPGAVGIAAGPEVAIMDEDSGLLPRGSMGEVVIRGPNVIHGYENNPEANAAAFSQSWFRTGDLGRIDEEGYLFLTGRIKELINRGGEKVSPREIDEILLDHPAVAQATTFAIPHARLGEDIAAAVVLREGTEVTPQQLREFAISRLAPHKVPRQIVVVPEIPKGPTGKPQRIGLHERLASYLQAAFVAPRDVLEASIARTWSEVLRVEPVSVCDNFFALGGDSLLAMQIVARLGAEIGIELPVSVLFQEPTVSALAAFIRTAKSEAKPLESETAAARPPIVRGTGSEPLPLSPAQERLWFLHKLQPESAAYNRPTNLRITGTLDIAVLEHSLNKIVQRHDVLRTVYRTENGQPVQVVTDAPTPSLTVVDLRDFPTAACDAEARRIAVEEARKPFDLENGPIWRARLVRLAEQDSLLLLTIHHIAFDGWSQDILVRELSQSYQAQKIGQQTNLPELPIQYADYAAWQRQWCESPEMDVHLHYWREKLDGAPTVLELPIDHVRPAVQTDHGAQQTFNLPVPLIQALQDIGHQQGATLFMTLLAAFDVLLARYTGQKDIVVGSNLTGRVGLETEPLIGLFVNTLPLRVDLSGNPSFLELLQRVSKITLEAHAHQETPLELLLPQLIVGRDLSRSALFQHLFNVKNLPPPTHRDEEPRFQPEQIDPGTSKFDLALELTPTSNGWQGHFEYNTDLFEAATIRRMIGHWKQLLAAIASDPQQHVENLPILTAAERQQVLFEWNNTGQNGPPEFCVHELFEAQAARTPDAVAVTYEGQQLTYGELNAQANQLARHLQTLEVGPEVLVGIFLQRSLDMAVALLAVLKAGGAYVPLDPDYPRERLDFVVADSQPAVVLTTTALADNISASNAQMVFMDADRAIFSSQNQDNLSCQVTPENAIYVIYTSGSTGRPKGAVNVHRGVSNLLLWKRAVWGLNSSERILFKTPLSFDVSVEEFFAPLISGCRVVMARPGGQREPRYLVELILSQGVTVAIFVPALLRILLEEHDVGLCRSLRLVANAGEALPPDLAELFFRQLDAVLDNGYGPTETSVIVTRWHGRERPDCASIPIGRPAFNVQVYILDDQRNPLPIGVPGELYIGGVAVGRGYLNRPELTAERFVPDPFSNIPGQRLYKTGDRCRYLPDGNIEFLGRLDNQVKIRGYRIELGEIEAALRCHPAVAQAAVIDRDDTPGDKFLAAYVVLRESEIDCADKLAEDLRQRLRTALPDYMVPRIIEFLPTLPQLPNGKLNRKGLPIPRRSAAYSQPDAVPRSTVEEQLASIWAEVLDVERVGIHDNFFEHGGHSLSAMRVISRIQRTFNVVISVRTLFELPTVTGLAEIIVQAGSLVLENNRRNDSAKTASGNDAHELSADGAISDAPQSMADEAVFPVSFAQRRLWFLHQLESDLVSYNMPFAFHIQGPLDRDALRCALEAIVVRHATLRTVFRMDQGELVQVVRSAIHMELPVLDLRTVPSEDRDVDIARRAVAEAERHFDLSKDPLLRASLLHLSDAEHVLLLTVHHIASDGWSMAVLWQELANRYTAYLRNDASPLPALPIPYAEYTRWQQEELQGDRLEQLVQYWRRQLADLPQVELPTDRPRPPHPTYQGSQIEFYLPGELVAHLQHLSQEEGCTLFMTLLAAFQILLARHARLDDIAVGTPIADRLHPNVESVVGCFLNTLVLRTNLSDKPSFRELLRRVRQTALEAYDHQGLPFEKLVEELRPDRSLNRNPLVQVLFQVLDFQDWQLNLAGLKVTPLPEAVQWARVDLELYLYPQPDGLRGTLLYSRDLWEEESMAFLAGQYGQLLAQIAALPDSPIDAYSLVTSESRDVLPDPCVPLDEPLQETVTRTIAEWARVTPNQIAVRQGTCHWTYRELQTAAETIAQQLLDGAAAAGNVVAVYGTPSFGLMTSMVGVLAGGAVLLPIDPKLPDARQRMFLDQARVQTVIVAADSNAEPDASFGDGIRVLTVDTTTGTILEGRDLQAAHHPPAETAPDAPAYLFFTSGTTGTPKGVLGCNKGLSHFVRWQRETFAVGAADRVAQLAGLSFDVMLRDVFLPLTSGGTLCLPEASFSHPHDFWHWLEREQITILHIVPTVLDFWLSDVPDDVSLLCLRYVFSAGEPLTDGLVRRWRECFHEHAEIINLYGPTETTMVKTYYRVPSTPAMLSGVQPIGRPLPNAQALVLDGNRRLCGIRESGEIAIRTPFRTLGYINDTVRMHDRFIPNPYCQDPNDLLYMTGDIGRYRPDGVLEILGRLDDQVKIHGVRIEPAEIAATIRQFSNVGSCYVTAMPDETGRQCLVAYVVPAHGADITPRQLRQELDSLLPATMIPSYFLVLDRLPVTPNGKVDRHELPAPDWSESPSGYAAPHGVWEESLAAIWRAVLHRDRISVHDNFFELGGHSLLAIRVVSRVRDVLRIDLPVRCIFENPTIAGLAAHLANREVRQAEPTRPVIRPVPRDVDLPLSFAQQRLWFLAQWEPNSAAYNMPVAVRLKGQLDIAALDRSLCEIVRRHEALRTTYQERTGQPFQKVAPHTTWTLPLRELTGISASDREQALSRVLTEEASQPFDLARDVLLRPCLIRMGDDDHMLLLTFHHIAADGWSLKVFFHELAALYHAFEAGRASPLRDLAFQYADYAVWQRKFLQGALLDEQLAYWKGHLADVPTIPLLPADHPRPAVQTFRGARQLETLSVELTQSLEQLSHREGVTLFMTLLAGLQTLLARYSGQEDIAVGSAIAGRNCVEVEPLIGFFINALVLRTDLSENPTFRELLMRVRDVALGAYAHQDLPFEKLVEELQPKRNLSQTPLFQVMFVMQNELEDAWQLPGLDTRPEIVVMNAAKFDLTISVTANEAGLQATLEYNTDLFDPQTILRLWRHFETLLCGIVADPDQRIRQLPLLTADEQRQILVEWNNTRMEDPPARCIHELFESQALSTPNAVAITFQDRELTYHELNVLANRWARYLRRCGVGPDVPVGLCVERSVEMIVGLLAILKAGGAYVPLAPNDPSERLAFVLQDTRVSIVLTCRHLAAILPPCEARLIFLDRDAEMAAAEAQENLPSVTTSENLAYIVYTSGSTGAPKGVCIPHRGVVRLVRGATYAHFGADEVFLQFSPLSFDAATFEIWGALLNGARLVVFPPGLPSAEELGQVIENADITTLWLTAGLFQEMVDRQLNHFRGLRQLLAGGDVLPVPPVHRVLRELPGCTMINAYGPTENTTFSCCYPMRQEDQIDSSVPIGRPIANTEAYVLDAYQQPVPVGIPGELYLGGDGLARGYWNRPDLTAERFVPNPFLGDKGACLYRTGDWVKWLPNGNLVFLGRMDFQVKIRGFRVELGEVEAVLSRHPGLRQCAVVARSDRPGDKRLAAFCVPADLNAPPNGEELREFLRQHLPDYMIPSIFTIQPHLPLTPNGKIDCQALIAAPLADLERQRRYVEAGDPSQLLLTQLWQELLGVPKIGIRDDFFALGGHSLLAIRMLSQIKELCGVQIPVAALFADATIESLARAMLELQQDQQESSLVEVQPGLETKRPFFFWHGDFNGGGFYCRNLARHIGPDQPFYAIHPYGMAGQPPRATIDAMAAGHLQLVLDRQPEGPYLLGGHCNGALEAFEIAQLLRAAGQTVELLVMISPPRRRQASPSSWAYAGLRYLLRSLFSILDNRLLARRLPWLRRALLYNLYAAACHSYTPNTYTGRVVLLQPGQVDHDKDPTRGWKNVALDLDMHPLPGGHGTSITAHAQAVAEHLRRLCCRL